MNWDQVLDVLYWMINIATWVLVVVWWRRYRRANTYMDAVLQVRKLHHPAFLYGRNRCNECRDTWPCPTYRLLPDYQTEKGDKMAKSDEEEAKEKAAALGRLMERQSNEPLRSERERGEE